MLRLTFVPVFLLLTFLFSFETFAQSSAGFNRLKAAGSGVSSGGEGGGSSEGSGGGSGGGSGKTGRLDGKPSGLNDIVFLGVFETYLIKERFNARISVYAEPRKFLLGHRACVKINNIRDGINQYLFKNPPKVDRRGTADTTGMDTGVREAIKKGLRTKLEYYTSVYVFSGRYNTRSIPKELQDQSITDCAGVIAKKKEMDKAKK